MKKVAILLACVLLAGCGDGEVEKVKSSPIKGYPVYTYGKVLDNHRVCEEATWNAYEENGIKKVSYICKLKKGKKSFNFDENEATKLRLNATNQYINKQNQYLPKEIEDANAGILNELDGIDKLKSMSNIENYFEYLAALDPKTNRLDTEIVTIYDGFQDYFSSAAGRKMVTEMQINIPNFAGGYNVFDDALFAYKKALERGITEEEANIFTKVNAAADKFVDAAFKKEIASREESLNVSKDRVRVLKERLSNPELIKKEAEAVGEEAVAKYSLFHILRGEEVIIWAWNPLDEKYDVERQYIKMYEYGDRYSTASLYIERLIYAVSNNISDVDTYMEYYRRTSLSELQSMIQTGKIK